MWETEQTATLPISIATSIETYTFLEGLIRLVTYYLTSAYATCKSLTCIKTKHVLKVIRIDYYKTTMHSY
jgi:hypothetical protein